MYACMHVCMYAMHVWFSPLLTSGTWDGSYIGEEVASKIQKNYLQSPSEEATDVNSTHASHQKPTLYSMQVHLAGSNLLL